MSDVKYPALRLAATCCQQRTSLWHVITALGMDPLPASAAETVARLLGVYTDAESAARAARSSAGLSLPFALEPPGVAAPGRRPSLAGRAGRACRRLREGSLREGCLRARTERAQRYRWRGRRSQPGRGAHSLRAYLRGRAPLRYFTRPHQRFE